MTERHFIVCEKDHAWQHSYRGAVTGPFKSRAEAIEDAITAAAEVEDPDVEVIVQDHDLSQQTVWRHGSQPSGTNTK